MSTIQRYATPWRMRLQPASFRGAVFHVEQQARSSGRRIVMHEFPKRDQPYAEDMGRQAVRYQMTGYIIGPNYQDGKEALIAALEKEGAGNLVDPYRPRAFQAVCERYAVTESRERGGYCVFDMVFSEAGSPGNSPMFGQNTDQRSSQDTQQPVKDGANGATKAAADSTNQAAAEIGTVGGFTSVPSLVDKPFPDMTPSDQPTTGGWF